MSGVRASARMLELQALNALQKLELQKLNKAVARRNKRIHGLQIVVRELREMVRDEDGGAKGVLADNFPDAVLNTILGRTERRSRVLEAPGA